MPATSLDLSQIKTDALSSAATFRSLIGLGTLATVSPTGTLDGTKFLRDDGSWQAVNLSAYLPLAGGTMTGALAITQGTANTSVLTSTGYSLTGSNAQSLIDVAGTWNTSGTPTAIKLNVTDTASNAASLLMDLQVGGSSRLSVGKNGSTRLNGISGTATNVLGVSRASTSSFGNLLRCRSDSLYDNAGFVSVLEHLHFEKYGSELWLSPLDSSLYRQWQISIAYQNSFLKFSSDARLEWYGATELANANTSDLVLRRDAAQTLAQRNGTSPQVHRIYNTFTDASNYERGQLAWESNEWRIGSAAAGTGAQRNLVLGSWNSSGTWQPVITVNPDTTVTFTGTTLKTTYAKIFSNPAGYHVFYDGQDVSGLTVSHVNYDPDTAAFISNSRNVNAIQGVVAFGNGGYSSADVAIKRTSANTLSVLRGNLSTPANLIAGTGAFNTGTITASTPAIDISQTWNNAAVAFTGIKANITNTASAAASNLLDLQVGGSSQFVIKNQTTAIKRSLEIDTLVEGGSTQLRMTFLGGMHFVSPISVTTSSIPRILLDSSVGVRLRDNASNANFGISWSNSSSARDTAVLVITRDAADTLAQRNGTNAQTFRLYNTFTDASNYERGKLEWSSNVLRIGTEKAGTGSARALELQTDGTTRLTIGDTGLFTIADALNIAVGTTTGTKIGTATNQKLGFFDKTPVVQPTAVADATDAASVITQLNALLSRMRDLGLIAT